MRLARADMLSTAWKHFEEDCYSRLAELRVSIESPLNEYRTAEVRGRISEIKRILALSAESAKQGVSPDIVFRDLEEHIASRP